MSGCFCQLQSALTVAEHVRRAAPCAARGVRRRQRGGQSQCGGVSDHAKWPLGCQACGQRGGRSRHAVSASAGAGRRRTRASGRHRTRADPRREQRPSCADCPARNSRAQGAPRCNGSAPPALRAADGLDLAIRDPFSRATIDGRVEVLDDVHERRYCVIIFAGCSSQPPPHRPMWSTFEPAVSGHGSFPDSQSHFLVVCSRDVTSAKPMTEPDCISASGRMQIRSPNSSSESSRCHGGTPVRSRCVGRRAQRAHSL